MARPLADLFIPTQVFATKSPFNPLNALAARINILEGKQPVRPVHPGLTDELWALMNHCWHRDSSMRPGMSVVSKTLRSSSVALFSQQPDIHSPDMCAVTSPAINSFSTIRARSLPVHNRGQDPRTQKRTNTLNLPHPFCRGGGGVSRVGTVWARAMLRVKTSAVLIPTATTLVHRSRFSHKPLPTVFPEKKP